MQITAAHDENVSPNEDERLDWLLPGGNAKGSGVNMHKTTKDKQCSPSS